jgi:hypothetical protein
MARPTFAAPAALLLLTLCAACRSDGDHARQSPSAIPAAPSALYEAGFDGSTGGAPADGWIVATTNSRSSATTQHARWETVRDADAPSKPGALALLDARGHVADTFNLCWRREPALADVDLTVAVRVDGGEEDQGGGPAWRVAGTNDYYVARWNPLEDNFRVYSVVNGERLQLDSARTRVDPKAWHTIRVRHVGDRITCWLDGEELLHATDAKLSAAGGVGVWTKADATTRFDDLSVSDASGR